MTRQRTKKKQSESIEILEELKDYVRKAGGSVIVDGGDFRSGVCKLNGVVTVVLNRSESLELHKEVLVEALRRLDTEGIYIKSRIRDLILQD